MLEGVFQDEHGDYPAGTYVRNPPTSSHTPGSEPGCTIFVKLSQFHPDDWTPVRIETSELRFSHAPDVPGVKFAVLHESAWELVLLERWAPGISIAVPVPEGIELLVLDGSFIEGGEEFTRLSWLRLPAGAMLQATAGRGGCKVWVKSAVWRMSRGCHLRPDIVKRIRITPQPPQLRYGAFHRQSISPQMHRLNLSQV